MNQYPHDEFDVVPENARREGSHRSFLRVRDPRSGIWTLVVIGLLALVLGAVMFFVVQPQAQTATSEGDESTGSTSTSAPAKSSGSADTATSTQGGGSEAPASTDASDQGSTAGSSANDPASSSSSTSGTESTDGSSSSSDQSGAADLSIAVGVYNGTGRAGLASGSATALQNAGYTNVRTANWTKRAGVSAVYYKLNSAKETAQAIAAKLGINTVVQTNNIPSQISVVVGTDLG